MAATNSQAETKVPPTRLESLALEPISLISGEVELPGSKSLSNRVLLLSALAEVTFVRCSSTKDLPSYIQRLSSYERAFQPDLNRSSDYVTTIKNIPQCLFFAHPADYMTDYCCHSGDHRKWHSPARPPFTPGTFWSRGKG